MNTWYPDLPIQSNPLKTKKDVQQAFLQLIEPLKKYYSKGKARLILGHTGVNFHTLSSQMEAFARPLWGLIPFTLGGGETDFWDIYLEGLKNGTNPEHPEYWGDIYKVDDQRIVEMPTIGLALALVPEKIWHPLNQKERGNLVNWLWQMEKHIKPDNNWIFFFVLVHIGLKKVGEKYDQDLIDMALNKVDKWYLSDGWYPDGPTDRRDYYVPFAMHFYSLFYATVMKNDDPERAKKFIKRSEKFANDFIYWFSPNGNAVPFGRSLTYRFAQGAFWGALPFAGGEPELSWGVIKGLYLRHLRWWFRQPIYTMDGVLTIGYAYPNLYMSEHYNAPGSPYWAMKAFIALALPDDHPFWQEKEEPLPHLKQQVLHEHARGIFYRNKKQDHIVFLTAGQQGNYELTHNYNKYSKFAYSNKFGFCISKTYYTLEQGAFDSMLALSDGENYWRMRQKCEVFKPNADHIYSLWKPWHDVQIESWIIPDAPWHIRIHKIKNQRTLKAAEGGFAIWDEENEKWIREEFTKIDNNSIAAEFEWGLSGVVNILGERDGLNITTHPNVNLLKTNSIIPTLIGDLPIGEHWLISAVYADTGDKFELLKEWNQKPSIKLEDKKISVISHTGKEIFEINK